jgi:hypothetical protein
MNKEELKSLVEQELASMNTYRAGFGIKMLPFTNVFFLRLFHVETQQVVFFNKRFNEIFVSLPLNYLRKVHGIY